MTENERAENLQYASRLYWASKTPFESRVAELLMSLFRGDKPSYHIVCVASDLLPNDASLSLSVGG